MVRIVVRRPAVMIHRRVQRLAGVADEMAHHAHDIDDVLLGVGNFRRRAAGFFQRGQRAETGLQFFVILRDRPRQKTAQLARVVGILRRINRRKFFRMRRAGLHDVRHKIVAQRRQRRRRQAVKFQIFQINVMIRPAGVAQREAACRSSRRSRCASGRPRRRETRCGRAPPASARTPENPPATTPAPVRSPRDGLR